MAQAFPFSAIVGQDEMKLAILAAAVDPRIGGVLVFGDRGTGTRCVLGRTLAFSAAQSSQRDAVSAGSHA